MNKLLEATIC